MFKSHKNNQFPNQTQNVNQNVNQNQGRVQVSQKSFQYDNLQQICSMGFPYGNLITFSLVQRLPQMNTRINDQKEKLFFFVTVVPGVGKQNQRTYDFKQRITQKFAIREVAGFAEILYQCVIGNETKVLPYVKYTSSENQSKSLSIWMSTKNIKIGKNNLPSRITNITILAGASYTLSLTTDQIFGMVEVLRRLVKKAIDLEFEIQFHQPKLNNGITSNQGINY